jgi:hypothetical protein
MKVARDAPPPRVRVRAYQWVIADRSQLMGWRPMVWSDVTADLVGTEVPDLPLASMKAAPDAPTRSDPADWPVDDVEAFARGADDLRARLRDAMSGDAFVALDRVFDALYEKADRPSMARTLRRLAVPEAVSLSYSGRRTAGGSTLSAERNNEFVGEVVGLKEPVLFTVKAEDFRTAPGAITVVPAPLLNRLVRTDYQPAYLFYMPPQLPEGDSPAKPYLAGKHQRIADKDVSLTGDRSVVSQVPVGTEIVFTATADKELVEAAVRPKIGRIPGARPGSSDPVPLPLRDDKKTFSVAFRGDYRITSNLEFDLEFQDTDGVRSRRPVLIQVAEDQGPTVEVAVDVIRKVGNVYYVTPKARIPFNPESVVKDDFGLSKVEYAFTHWAEVSEVAVAFQARQVARVFLDTPAPARVPSALLPAAHTGFFVGSTAKPVTGSIPVGRFFEMQRALPVATREMLDKLLPNPAPEGLPELVKKVELKSPEADFFDLPIAFRDPETGENKLLARSGEVQTRYRIDLNIVATDTNLDTGAKTGKNQEAIRLLVVSEADLLAEIGKEESGQNGFADRLKQAQDKLTGARAKMAYVRSKNGVVPETERDVVRVRAQDAAQDVAKARDTVQGVLREYRRVHRECLVNRVNAAATAGYGMLANRLDRMLGENPPAVGEEEQKLLASGALRPLATFPQGEKALAEVVAPLAEERWASPESVSDADMVLTKLSEELQKIRDLLGEKLEYDRLTVMID